VPRLLYISTSSAFMGFLFPFAKHFRQLGWRVDAMASGVGSSAACRENFDHVWEAAWSRNPLHPHNLTITAGQVRRTVAEGGYDIVHVHTPVAGFVTRFALRDRIRRAGLTVVYTAHGFHFHPLGGRVRNAAFRSLEKLAGRWTDRLVVINRTDEDAARALEIVPPERLVHMPGIGVDTRKYSPENVPSGEISRVRAELRLRPGQALFSMFAEFIPRKRHADVLQAFRRIPRGDCHLALAGAGPLVPEMRRLAARLGIADRVHFLGMRSDVPALMRASVATVLPSLQEGLSRSVMESLCLGIPVIGSDIRGIRELVGPEAGLLMPPMDPAGFAQAMGQLLRDPGQAAQMGRNGRQQMVEFDLVKVLAAHEKLYQTTDKGAFVCI
jgi:glycosyltransferase involved in cell wall biosynthesis